MPPGDICFVLWGGPISPSRETQIAGPELGGEDGATALANEMWNLFSSTSHFFSSSCFWDFLFILIFINLTLMCLGMLFVVSILLGVPWNSGICGLTTSLVEGKFQLVTLQILFFCLILFLSFRDSNYPYVRSCLILFHWSWVIYFFVHFPLYV